MLNIAYLNFNKSKLVELIKGSNASIQITDEELKQYSSYFIHTLTQFFIASNCPNKFHPYILGLIRISEGKIEFPAKRDYVSDELRVTEKDTTHDANIQWLKYTQSKFEQWQIRYGFDFIIRIPGGGQLNKQNLPRITYIGRTTKYRLNILTYIGTAIREAMELSLAWKQNPLKAIEIAVNEEVRKLQL